MGTVRWLQPAGIQRRPRRRPPVVPILLLIVVLAGAAGTGYVLLARQAAADRRQEAVERFATAWEKRDYPAMWRLISPQRRRDWPLAEFASSYRIAAEEATVKSVRVRIGAAAFGPISLAGYSPGRYRVLVTVTDVESKAAYAQEAWFEVHSERTALSWSGDTPSAAGAAPKH